MSQIPGRLLIHTAAIQRPSTSAGRVGGVRKQLEAVASAEPCRYVEGMPSEVKGVEQYAGATGSVYFASASDVMRQDELTIDGKSLRVIGVLKPSDRAHHQKVIVEERERAR